jgi:hypothetical protein
MCYTCRYRLFIVRDIMRTVQQQNVAALYEIKIHFTEPKLYRNCRPNNSLFYRSICQHEDRALNKLEIYVSGTNFSAFVSTLPHQNFNLCVRCLCNKSKIRKCFAASVFYYDEFLAYRLKNGDELIK